MHFIGDQYPGEPDILTPVMHEGLSIIEELDNEVFRLAAHIKAPKDGWTNMKMYEAYETIESLVNNQCIIDAYVGKKWIGSSEC